MTPRSGFETVVPAHGRPVAVHETGGAGHDALAASASVLKPIPKPILKEPGA
ncbi:hypothetical protein Pta02_34090 [Planobispora takensis]|uniref:Uncharacterized protein n=1 Tax=Planobispora takensis TaxID=1367882 RepID=A0A8J3SX94_9ACTN|nr:hypothetical protein Pta02_34090 [Planobispora takensis]